MQKKNVVCMYIIYFIFQKNSFDENVNTFVAN